jgi:hypothetical protein
VKDHIESGKILIKDAFARWYRVPEYQRPYVWGVDQVSDLLEDVSYALSTKQEGEYFLGSIVLQTHKAGGDFSSDSYDEHDLLDGQQRLATCLMLHAVARDLTTDDQLKDASRRSIFQQENKFDGIPERLRIVFDIRDNVSDFVDKFLKKDGGTNDEDGLVSLQKSPDPSVQNMATAVLEMRKYFARADVPSIEDFFKFFRNKVLLIYVASSQLEDAFRLFLVLNDRGMKLRNSDILKTLNLRALKEAKAPEHSQRQAAQMWEEMEGSLGDDFDTFLAHLRTVLVKEKARLSLLQEFEQNIYERREFLKDKKEYKQLPPLLHPGRETFDFMKRHWSNYQQIFSGANHHVAGTWEFDNLITLLADTGLADFWVPPLLHYRDVFGEERITDFLALLENKFCGDWILRETPTTRIENMNAVIKKTDEAHRRANSKHAEGIELLLQSGVFAFDITKFVHYLDVELMYGRRFARYILYKLDMIYGGKGNRLQPPREVSVEHILPQNPADESQWCKDFSAEAREIWTDRLGNLVLISGRKNSAQGREDYASKKINYFKKNIETFPNSLRVLNTYTAWAAKDLQANHTGVLDNLRAYIETCHHNATVLTPTCG